MLSIKQNVHMLSIKQNVYMLSIKQNVHMLSIKQNVHMLSIKQNWRQGIGYEFDGKGLLFTYFFGITDCLSLNYNLIMLICLNLSHPLGA